MLISVSVVVLGLAVWRWSVVTSRTMDDDECRSMAERIVAELVHWSQDHSDMVPIEQSFWDGMGRYQPIELARWMNGHKYVTTDDWGWMNIMLGHPPRAMALTKRECDKAIAGITGGNVIFGNGNINIDGVQVVAGGDVRMDSASLTELAAAVRWDADGLDSLEKQQALHAVGILNDAASGLLDQSTPIFQGTVVWLRERASQAIGGAMGTALWTATSAALVGLFG